MKHIAVLLTVFNRKDNTLCCLERLYAQLPIDGGSWMFFSQTMAVLMAPLRRKRHVSQM